MRYYYDPELGDCRQFVYGGCHGNANRFLTYSDCETTCKQVLPTAANGLDVDGNRRSTFHLIVYMLLNYYICITTINGAIQ